MKVDAFTTIAQIVNFLVLALLLKRYLYKPIVRTMDRRESEIAARIEEGELRELRAREAEALCQVQRQELEDRRGEMLSHAQEEAGAWRQDIMQKARDEATGSKAAWAAALEREKETFLTDLKRRAGEEVYSLARQVLRDLANMDLEQHIIDVFIQRLDAVSGDDWERIALAAADVSAGAVVCTAFAIDGDTRSRIRVAIERQLKQHAAGGEGEPVLRNFNINFEESPDLICGIELRAGGRRAAWSMQNYLESLQEQLSLAFTGRREG
ncbi:MAG: F0F1 ATP synthase subunit B family protein [Thermoleophilia bacterium]